MMEYFQCWHSYEQKLKSLSDDEIGRLFRALLRYSSTGERIELPGIESLAFDFIACDIDKAREAYDAKCARNSKNASKRWNATISDGMQTDATVCECMPNDATAYERNKVKESKGKESKVKDSSRRFTPPTLAEVDAYCRERGNGLNAEKFISHYEAVGWRVGKNPMRDWRAAVRTWENNGIDRRKDGSKSFADLWREMPDE